MTKIDYYWTNQELIRVGRDYPCPICGKPDWCLVFADQI